MQTSREHSILSFSKHYENVTLVYSLNILKQVITFLEILKIGL